MAGCTCGCGETLLLFACSGCADVGEISDRVARKMTREGHGSMACLAGIGGDVSGIVASARGADRLVTIDGCPLVCARKTLEAKDLSPAVALTLTDMGLTKGSSPASEDNVRLIFEKCVEAVKQTGRDR